MDLSSSGISPTLTALSGSASSLGNNLLITPTTGARLHIYYVSYNNSGVVEAAFRFGTAGTLFLRNNLVMAGSIVAKEFGTKYLAGAVNEALYLNLSQAVSTIWNVFYSEA